MRLNVRQYSSILVFGLAALCVLLLLGLSISRFSDQLADDQLIQELIELRITLDGVQRRMLEAETVQLSYAMTGLPIFKEEFLSYSAELRHYLEDLEQTKLENSIQTGRAARMTELIRDRLYLMDKMVATRDARGFEATLEMVAGSEGKVLMDQIRSTIDTINAEQIANIRQIQGENLDRAGEMSWILTVCAILNIGFMFAVMYGFRRQFKVVRETVSKLEDNSRMNSVVIELNKGLQSCSTLKDAEEIIAFFVKQLFPYETGSLYVMRSSRNALEIKVGWGQNDNVRPIMEPAECWALRLGQVHMVSHDSMRLRCRHYSESLAHSLCIPMMAEGEAIGLLHFSFPEATQASSLKVVQNNAEILASHIGPALASLTLREQLKLQSVRDGLTGLYNRRYLEESIAREIHRAERMNGGFGILIADIDHFKQLNDRFGHQAGDEVLVRFAQFLKEQVRGEDIVCRYGGEEFVIVLPGTNLAHAQRRAEMLCRGVHALPMKFHGQALPPLTVSIGVAAYPDHGNQWENVLRAADLALYKAKQTGRARVIVADPDNLTANPGDAELILRAVPESADRAQDTLAR